MQVSVRVHLLATQVQPKRKLVSMQFGASDEGHTVAPHSFALTISEVKPVRNMQRVGCIKSFGKRQVLTGGQGSHGSLMAFEERFQEGFFKFEHFITTGKKAPNEEQILNFFIKNQKYVIFGSKNTYLVDTSQGRRTVLPVASRPNPSEPSDCKTVR